MILLHSPNLTEVDGLEDAQLLFISHTIVNIFYANRVYPTKFSDKCMENRKNFF